MTIQFLASPDHAPLMPRPRTAYQRVTAAFARFSHRCNHLLAPRPDWRTLNEHLLTDIGETPLGAEIAMLHDPSTCPLGTIGLYASTPKIGVPQYYTDGHKG